MTDRAAPRVDAAALVAHAERLRALARSLVTDGADADDVVQQTFVAAIEHPPRPDLPPGPWLTRVARNFSFRVLRSRRRRALHEAAAAPSSRPTSPDEAVARTELMRDVVDEVLALEPLYRDVVIARFFDGLAWQDVASRLGVPVETARTRLKRALAILRERLDRRHGGRAAWLLVLGHRQKWRVASVAAAAGGLLMLKKVVAAVVLVVLGVLAWHATQNAGDAPASSAPHANTAAAAAEAAHPRTRAAEEPPPAPESPPPPPAEITGPKATGRVVDESGRPIAGARVVSMPDDIRETFSPDDAGTKAARTFRATTGADGRFAIRLDDKAPGAMLVADAPGRSVASVSPVRAGDDVAMTLAPAASLWGNVTDLEGAPIGGAEVRVYDLVQAVRIVRTGRSAADGSYRVDGLPALDLKGAFGQRWIEVVADGWAPLMLEYYRTKDVRRDLVLVRGAKVAGRVLDAETGAPVAGAHVVLWSIEGMMGFGGTPGGGWMNPWGERQLGETTSAADGAFAFDHVPSEGFHQSASHNAGRAGGLVIGHVAAWRDGWTLASDEVPLRASGTTIDTVLKLWPAAMIEGRALLADGKPAADATIISTVEGRAAGAYATPCLRDRNVPTSWAYSAADGSFRIAGVPAARGSVTSVKVDARAKRMYWIENADATATVDVRAGEPVAPLTLTFTDAKVPSIDLRVRDAEGRPVWGAATSLASSSNSARTDAAGFVRIAFPYLGRPGGRAPEETDVTIRARGFATTTIRATPSADAAEIPVTLAPGHRVAGRVTWSDGTPAEGVFVQAADGSVPVDAAFPPNQTTSYGGQRQQGRTVVVYVGATSVRTDGTFEITDLPEAPCHVAAITNSYVGVAPGMPPKAVRDIRQSVTPGTEDLAFVLPKDPVVPTQTVEGTLRDAATGRAVTKATLVLIRPGAARNGEMTAPARFQFRSVPLGTWTLRADVPGYVPFELAGVEVAAGAASAPIDVVLDRGATVRGVVHTPSGAIANGLTIWFRPASPGDKPSANPSVPVRPDGSFEATGFAPGAYHVSAGAGNPWQTDQPPLVVADGRTVSVADAHATVTLDLTFAVAGTLMVNVADPRLPPIPYSGQTGTDEQTAFGAAATAEIRDAAGAVVASQKGLAQNFAGAAGRLDVLPGTYTVRVTFPGEAAREQTVEVKAGAQARVNFKP